MIKVVDALDDSLLDEAWTLYYTAFHELNAFAVQRHLMYRHEFDDVVRDTQVDKYLWLDDAGVLGGLATYTNDLNAVPLIAPQYFERRWPQLYAEHRIWYCGFVGVHPAAQNNHRTFVELVGAMARIAHDAGGIICIDMCRFNDEVRRLSTAIPAVLERCVGQVRAERMDDQSYWLYEFPLLQAAGR